MVPFDTQSPFVTSGIRVGTPAVTTRGMKEADMAQDRGLDRCGHVLTRGRRRDWSCRRSGAHADAGLAFVSAGQLIPRRTFLVAEMLLLVQLKCCGKSRVRNEISLLV